MPKVIDQTQDSTKDIEWGRDDDDTKVFTIRDSAGVPLDISLYDFDLTVNAQKDPTATDIPEFTIAGVFVTDGTDGKVGFTPAVADTDIAIAKYFYDLQWALTGSGLQKKTLIKAVCHITQDITK
jgi:hypothetical protein